MGPARRSVGPAVALGLVLCFFAQPGACTTKHHHAVPVKKAQKPHAAVVDDVKCLGQTVAKVGKGTVVARQQNVSTVKQHAGRKLLKCSKTVTTHKAASTEVAKTVGVNSVVANQDRKANLKTSTTIPAVNTAAAEKLGLNTIIATQGRKLLGAAIVPPEEEDGLIFQNEGRQLKCLKMVTVDKIVNSQTATVVEVNSVVANQTATSGSNAVNATQGNVGIVVQSSAGRKLLCVKSIVINETVNKQKATVIEINTVTADQAASGTNGTNTVAAAQSNAAAITQTIGCTCPGRKLRKLGRKLKAWGLASEPPVSSKQATHVGVNSLVTSQAVGLSKAGVISRFNMLVAVRHHVER